jgi:8-oxo-dGTP pyrophosphatase MutT (NUDIX family)
MSKKNETICKNCNSIGHTYRECPYPISSYGIICYVVINKELHFLMIQRKNSLSFMEFIKGNYKSMDIPKINKLIQSMTKDEQQILDCNNFDIIWEKIWFQSNNKNTKEYIDAKTNFDSLMQRNILKEILSNNVRSINEPEWGFPKGRKKQNEKDIECSLREFTEETQFKAEDIKILDYTNPYNEIFFGTNKILYKHTYYIANFVGNIEIPKFNKQCMQQIREIRAIKWMNYNDVIKHLNSHNIERIEIFKNIYNNLKKYISNG